ncbi:MAG: hypothetical protein FJ306_09170 [Planctomycetes bacterium]|nr:hypothetical protein [Planctomycetota bacterium]
MHLKTDRAIGTASPSKSLWVAAAHRVSVPAGVTLLSTAIAAAQTNVRAWQANGQVFVVWRVPSATGGVYQLAANEGLFVHTPRAAGSEHFAVVRDGSTAISATNSTVAAVAVGYDPVNDPVTCHLQLADVSRAGTRSRRTRCGSTATTTRPTRGRTSR